MQQLIWLTAVLVQSACHYTQLVTILALKLDTTAVMWRSNQGGIGKQLDGKMSLKLRERAEQALAMVRAAQCLSLLQGVQRLSAKGTLKDTSVWHHLLYLHIFTSCLQFGNDENQRWAAVVATHV